ncbi:MAG: YfiR/HmsC family protein [Bacteroidales bacterium]|nr:YfiR/HmsC family protein [Bacteroidales bacterium]
MRFLFVLVIMTGTGVLSYAQVAPEILRSYWIVTSCESAEWKNFKSPNDFTIGVYGFMAEEINSLNEIAAERKINDRNLVIKHFRKLKDITPTDVLFVNNHYNEELEQLYSIAVANKSLLMTDRAPSDRYFMINLLLEGKEKEYEINAENAAVADIIFSEKMSNQGGSTLDLREMYVKKDKELKIKEEQLQIQKAQLDEKEVELKRQIEENRIITEQNKQLADELNKTEEEIEVQKTKAAILMDQVRDQQAKLAQNQLKLSEQEHEINSKQQQIESSNSELREKENQLTERENKIREQESTIRVRNTAIDQNSTVITGIIIFIGVIVFLVVLIVRAMRLRKLANIALKKKNSELMRQTEEINNQAKELEKVNVELEKLSIVAGKTQNAIVIMDRNGYFEWVNAGFTRYYGYTLQLLRNERDENIVNVSSNKSIRNILFKCVSNKQTIVFESLAETRYGKKIASQITLSPILNNEGEVTQLVAIYSDINKLKEQEAAIRSQNEELLQQKNTLEVQKNQIEEQNKHIKASIYYAQTIQKTILPPVEQIEKYFDCFVLFRPKDIVSGDFYWFSEVQDDGHSYQFIGDLDCTGHGVPGAFMSLIGNRILNEVINVKKTYSPRDIMDQLNKNVIKALKQDQSTNNDGMDTCFCRIEKIGVGDYSVTFCGAKRPLYYFTSTEEDVKMLKGDRKSIGGTQQKRGNIEFTNQEIIMHSGDIMYLSSDGIIDQNDADRKRFGTDNFLAMLKKYKNEPMSRQGEYFAMTLDNYRKDEEQRDDISVIGIKFK